MGAQRNRSTGRKDVHATADSTIRCFSNGKERWRVGSKKHSRLWTWFYLPRSNPTALGCAWILLQALNPMACRLPLPDAQLLATLAACDSHTSPPTHPQALHCDQAFEARRADPANRVGQAPISMRHRHVSGEVYRMMTEPHARRRAMGDGGQSRSASSAGCESVVGEPRASVSCGRR